MKRREGGSEFAYSWRGEHPWMERRWSGDGRYDRDSGNNCIFIEFCGAESDKKKEMWERLKERGEREEREGERENRVIDIKNCFGNNQPRARLVNG